MTPERWRQIEHLYNLACDRGEEVLANADPELRRKVQEMLAQKSAGGMLDQAAFDLMTDSSRARMAAGSTLGPYRIEGLLGRGGMGEVYRAHDPRLRRDVAIKISAAEISERFEREARAVAALNHPNICQIYDVGPNYLVMELIEGESPRGPMGVDEVLRIARQIASALGAAHEKGIVHRDLKPDNIKIKSDGVVKVLDFGLAKRNRDQEEAITAVPATATMSKTEAGIIVGTVAYMAPEQALGKEGVDKRADIWAFGVLLYRLLTGRALFTGESPGEILAQVIRDEPDLSAVPAELQPLLKKCLEKDPKKRLQDIGDMELLLQPAGPAAILPAGGDHQWAWMASIVVLSLALAVVAFIHFHENPEPAIRTLVAAPEGTTIVQDFAISPDGRYLVMAAEVHGTRQLWLRPLNASQPQPMPNTEDALHPFWSPDSRNVGFFAQGKLKRVAVSGGPAQSICDAANGRGGSWSRDGVIVFSPDVKGISIQRVAAAGGVPVDVTRTKGDQEDPVFLPDGRNFLYLAIGGPPEQSGIFVSSLDGTANRRILADLSGAVFASPARGERTGYLLFIRENTLMAAPFDAGTAQFVGDTFPVAQGVSVSVAHAAASVSDGGILVFRNGPQASQVNQIGWYDRHGNFLGPVGAPGAIFDPAISPDERSVAFFRQTSRGSDIWVRDLIRGTETALTNDSLDNQTPFWSPEGDRIVFSSHLSSLYQKAAHGSGQEEILFSSSLPTYPSQWSTGGYIVFFQIGSKTERDIWVLPTEGEPASRKATPFLTTEADEFMGQLSPNGHWMAFTSDRSGRREVYVRPFPSGQGEWTISVAGGQAPRWSHDGKELFYEAADGKITAVSVKREASSQGNPSFEAGAPVALFDAHLVHTGIDTLFQYDVATDGRFLIDQVLGTASPPLLTLVTNWTYSLNK